jgi:hypothetical protein
MSLYRQRIAVGAEYYRAMAVGSIYLNIPFSQPDQRFAVRVTETVIVPCRNNGKIRGVNLQEVFCRRMFGTMMGNFEDAAGSKPAGQQQLLAA